MTEYIIIALLILSIALRIYDMTKTSKRIKKIERQIGSISEEIVYLGNRQNHLEKQINEAEPCDEKEIKNDE